MQNQKTKIIVGLSGGVDSSAALILLKEQGFEPLGVTLKLPVWSHPQNLCRDNICCTPESLAIAQEVCHKLKVPYFIVDAQSEFQKYVLDYFLKELKNGRTPNPCLICNHALKFKYLLQLAQKCHIPYVASGHYARVRFNKKTGVFELLKGKDQKKDQSYFLSSLTQNQLAHLILPLGTVKKQEVYKLVKDKGFHYFEKKKESQNFCFVSNQSLPLFLKESLGLQPGPIIDTQGKVLGFHQGLYLYTIGQRKGINLPQGPYYVQTRDLKTNTLIVTKKKKDLLKKEIILTPYHFISEKIPQKKIKVQASIRYRQKLSSATLFPPRNKKIKIIFAKPQFAVTPGQFCVFYQREKCLGNGVIV